MRKYLFYMFLPFWAICTFGASPTLNVHKDFVEVDQEFRNVYDSTQDKSIVSVTTPAYSNMTDGVPVWVNTGNFCGTCVRVSTNIFCIEYKKWQ